MADLMLDHAGIENSCAELEQAASRVIQAMDDLAHGLQPMVNTFSGRAATAFTELTVTVSQSESTMRSALSSAVTALREMHETHVTADLRGAGNFS